MLENCEESELDTKEAYWLHQFRHHVVNDPIMWTLKPPKRNTKKILKSRDWKRLEHIQEARKEYRKKVQMVLRTEDWRSWDYKTKLSLIVQMQKAKVESSVITCIK